MAAGPGLKISPSNVKRMSCQKWFRRWSVEVPKRNSFEQHNSFSRTSHLNSRALRLQQLRLFEEVLHGSLGIAWYCHATGRGDSWWIVETRYATVPRVLGSFSSGPGHTLATPGTHAPPASRLSDCEGSWRCSSGVMDGMATSFPHLLHVANSACCLAKTRVRPGHVIFPWSIWSDLRDMNVDLVFRCQSSLVENGDWADCTWSNTFGNSTTAMLESSECLNVAIFWRTKRLHIRWRMV